MYTELSVVKEILGIDPGDTTKDSTLIRLIEVSTDYIRTVTEREFAETTVKELYAGTGTDELLLNNFPVSGITKIKIDGVELDSGTYDLEEKSGIVYKYDYWAITSNSYLQGIKIDSNMNNIKRNIEVEYTYGYKLPGTVGRNFPYDLEQVVINLVVSGYKSLGKTNNIKSEKIMDTSYTYDLDKKISYTDTKVISKYSKWV